MCYIGPDTQLEAEKDIKVFKVCWLLDNQIISLVRQFEYQQNSEYYTKILAKTFTLNRVMITCGFHSYSEEDVEISSMNSFFIVYNKKEWKDKNIVYGVLNEISKEENARAAVIKLHCIIPAGSTYYMNERGIYVSNALKTLNYELVT